MKYICSLLVKPRYLLTAAVVFGAMLTILIIIFPVLYRDSVNYMASVNAVWLGNWKTAFNITFVPFLFITSSFFKLFGLNANQCLSLVSSIFSIGMIFPAYRILHFFLNRRAAALGSVLFFMASPILNYGFAPLTDSGRWFFMLTCLMLIFDYLRSGKKFLLFLLGFCYAALALIRSEGIVFVGLMSIWFFIELIRREGWNTSWKKCFRFIFTVSAPLFIMFILLLPRLWQIYHETGFAALDTRQTWAVKAVIKRIFPKLSSSSSASAVANYGEHMDYHSFWSDIDWHKRYWMNLFTGNWIVYAIFSVIGFLSVIRNKKWKYFHTLFCIFTCVNALTYMLMRSCAGRYFMINTFLLMPFTLCGLQSVWKQTKKTCSGKYRKELHCILLCTAAAVFISLAVKGVCQSFSNKTAVYVHVGKFMREQTHRFISRSKTEHPVYLILGDNYGWGLFCDGNELVYSNHFNVRSKFSIEYILKHGLSPEYCSFAVDPLDKINVLKPDFLLDNRKKRELSSECRNTLEVIKHPQSSQVDIYRVRL